MHFGRLHDQVAAQDAGNRHKGDLLLLVAHLLQEVVHDLLDVFESGAWILYGDIVHLRHPHDNILDAHGKASQGQLSCSAIVHAHLEFSLNCRHNKHSHIRKRSHAKHVFGVACVAGRVHGSVGKRATAETREAGFHTGAVLAFLPRPVEHPNVLASWSAQVLGKTSALSMLLLREAAQQVAEVCQGGAFPAALRADDHNAGARQL
mmetsp:Transcript_93340/g.237580  ORF Transcript_93340/g.237580 Transcript_93340/m.237580 type:complete len:206 (-) Transcript_93340:128-745(-)